MRASWSVKKINACVLGLIVTQLATVAVWGQESTDPDELFRQARELGFSGHRQEARELCNRILEGSPDYHDVRVFLARVFAWDGDYEAARLEIGKVLAVRPDYLDARRAAIDVERWSDNPEAALSLVNEGLELYADNEDLLYRKARVLWVLDDVDGARDVLRELLAINPANSEARALQSRLYLLAIHNEVSVTYEHTDFNDFDPWRQVSLQFSHGFGFGSVLWRANNARRFSRRAWQYEIDMYPRLGGGVYLYVNYGYSGASFFPEHRGGLEVFASLPKSFEMSAGFRYLEFSSSDVTIYTASVGKYHGNYWLSLRTYVTPGDDETSASGSWTVRRYFADADNYVSFRVGGGSSPEEVRNVTDLQRLDSYSAAVSWQKALSTTLHIGLSLSHSREDLPRNRKRRQTSLSIGLKRRF